MTERFKKLVSSIDYYDLWDTVEDKGYVAEDLANALYEENEQLKKESYGNLDGLNYYQEQIGHLSSKISDLECENEQLKDFIRKEFPKSHKHILDGLVMNGK